MVQYALGKSDVEKLVRYQMRFTKKGQALVFLAVALIQMGIVCLSLASALIDASIGVAVFVVVEGVFFLRTGFDPYTHLERCLVSLGLAPERRGDDNDSITKCQVEASTEGIKFQTGDKEVCLKWTGDFSFSKYDGLLILLKGDQALEATIPLSALDDSQDSLHLQDMIQSNFENLTSKNDSAEGDMVGQRRRIAILLMALILVCGIGYIASRCGIVPMW